MKGVAIAALAVIGGAAALVAGLALVLAEEIEPIVFDEDED